MHPQQSGEDGQLGPPEPTYSPAPHGQPAQYEQPPQYGQPAPYGQLPVQYPQQVGQPPPDDPLVNADYGGWWRRAIAIIRVAWPQLLVLNLVGAVVGTVLQTPLAVVLSRLPLKVEESLASDEFTFGIGLQYDANRNVGARLQWQRYTTDPDIDLITIGVVFKF